MRLVSGTHFFVWGSMAALLYAGAANLHRDVNHIDPDTPLSNPARAVGDLKDMLGLKVRSAFVDPVSKLAPPELEVTDGIVRIFGRVRRECKLHRSIPLVGVRAHT